MVEIGGGEFEEVVGPHRPDRRHCCGVVRIVRVQGVDGGLVGAESLSRERLSVGQSDRTAAANSRPHVRALFAVLARYGLWG